MALPAACLSEDQFTCSICLEVFNNPVSTPCGHSFCQSCICSYWDRGGGGQSAKSYQCPMCKESFQKRPELHINRTLKEITEQFKQLASSGLSSADSAVVRGSPNAQPHPNLPAPPRHGDMPESIFVEMVARFQRLNPAGMPHVGSPEPQSYFFQTQNNRLLEPPPPPYSTFNSAGSPADVSSNLPLCPIHLRALELFCRTDNVCVCSSCTDTAEHRGHTVVPAQREWQIKKSQVEFTEVELKDLISDRERKVEEIQNSIREIRDAAEKETEDAVCAFSKLISSVEHCQSKVVEGIELSLQAAESRAQSVLRELQEEITALKKKSCTLTQLAEAEDITTFLKRFPSESAPPQVKDWSGVSVTSQLTSGPILRTVNQMMEHLQEHMQKLMEICQRPSPVKPVPRSNPKVKRVQEYAENITLNPSTAHPRLIISP
ncbi:tripartite motif-containing protein 65, partial [Austrofundulus limnaeus]|uniref:Tripartite motif-containing protein 65 n=1 Tax=Austrofundulus limnaeus TaxID=52670 RepID=A0A2I4CUF4_AUSLI